MKRIFVTILSVLYMLSATGATVHMHYCMGELMSTGFIHKDEHRCAKCGMKKTAQKGCCKDEHKSFKTGDHHAAKVVFAVAKEVRIYIPATFRAYECALRNRVGVHGLANANAPPPCWRTCPLYIRIRNLRI